MTEREKMLAGELYDCGDAELLTQWHKAKDLVRDYNQTNSADADEKERILKELLGEKGFDVKECLSYLDRNSTNFKKGLTVTTFYLAKGLEFDQVFALYTTQDNTPLHRQARYICATRALHELYMYEVKASQD